MHGKNPPGIPLVDSEVPGECLNIAKQAACSRLCMIQDAHNFWEEVLSGEHRSSACTDGPSRVNVYLVILRLGFEHQYSVQLIKRATALRIQNCLGLGIGIFRKIAGIRSWAFFYSFASGICFWNTPECSIGSNSSSSLVCSPSYILPHRVPISSAGSSGKPYLPPRPRATMRFRAGQDPSQC
jgi:hypothetical protein